MIRKFEKTVKDCRRIHILHGHYTPMGVIEENKHKIIPMYSIIQ